ncbi:MAG: sulfite exporter TauE/SafE family protein [Desulfuromonadaceae bacterium]|nr:sulfite exporter TauE/SafE family protein [Desulfuromonadaceae bacterium]
MLTDINLITPILVLLAFFTSALSAVTAVGGGMLFISVLTLFLPIQVVIPVHAVTQLASNCSRAAFSPASIVWPITIPFVTGVILGIPGALNTYQKYQVQFSALPLGIFVLLMVWLPPQKIWLRLTGNKNKGTVLSSRDSRGADEHGYFKNKLGWLGFGALGFIQTFLTLFVGSSAPVNLPFLLRLQLTRDQLVITSATMMTAVSAIKILIFIAAGFGFAAYSGLISGLVVAMLCGSWAGTRMRHHVPEYAFKRILKLILTVLSLRLVILACI